METKSVFNAARYTAIAFGILAGLGGLVHGIGEVLQGNVRPDGIVIDSWTQGPIATNMGGEPGMTVVPNLLATGILTVLVSLAVVVCAATARSRKNGQILLLLSVLMLLVGGGFGPPVIGILAGVAGTGIGKPSTWWRRRRSAGVWRILGTIWPWIFGLAVINGVFLVIGSVILVYCFDLNNPDLFTNSFYLAILSLFLTISIGRLYDLPMKKLALVCLLLLVAVLGTTPALTAQAVEAPSLTIPVPEVVVSSGPSSPEEMEAFLDDFFEAKMAELHIPGAAIVVVQDGRVFLAKGYGFADLDRQIPVDPTRTAFRAGSVSKLFTWTAVMQAAERGLLDLDTDVNRYLADFRIPDTYPQPVTLAHLLTHTAGFEYRWLGSRTRDPAEIEPLGRALAEAMPKRVEAPGIVHSYSNYGASLAGHLVEQVSGLSFDRFVEENILQPLGMDGSTFRQPLPQALAANVATGHLYANGELQTAPLTYSRMAPADGITLTPIDMAAFMIAHLHEGEYGNVRILEPATAQEMHRQQFTHHPDMPGMAYGFKERFVNGLRIIGHGGDIQTFASQMALVPEEDLGFFVVYNRFDDAFREQLISAFFDHYYPDRRQDSIPQAVEMSAESLEHFAGSYRWVKYPHGTLGKLIALVPGPYPILVRANQDTSLSLSFFGADAEWRYVPVGENTFKKVEGGSQLLGGLYIDPGDTLAFQENETGEIVYGFVPLQNTAFEKLAWYESAEAQLGTMGSLLLLFASAVVLWPLGALIERLLKRSCSPNPARRRPLWLAWIVSALDMVFLLVFLLSFGEGLVYGVPWPIGAILVIPLATSILSVVLAALAVTAWLKGYWSFVGRLFYSAIALASVLFVLFASYWNMLGWRF